MSVAQYTPASLAALLKSLSISDSTPNHQEILKHADNVLSTNKDDSTARHTRVVALLNLERYQDALRQLESAPLPHANFEKAYALYKTGKLVEAIRVAQESQGSASPHKTRALEHVHAQSLYRLEKFDQAYRIYHTLSEGDSNQAANESFDLRVNYGATEAQLAFSGTSEGVSRRKITAQELAAFETSYNAACMNIARNELGQALVLLKRAKELCNALDLTEQEKQEELAPVLVQQLYALLKLGKEKETTDVVRELILDSLSDPSVKLVGYNNEITNVYRSSPNPHLALRRFDATVTHPSAAQSAKLFRFQTRILERNKVALEYATGKFSAVSSEAQRLGKQTPEDRVAAVLQAAGGSEGKDPLKEIEKSLRSEKSNIGLSLMTAQLQMGQGNITGAITTVESMMESIEESERYQPGLVALAIALYTRQGRTQHVRGLLQKASNFWKSTSQPNQAILRAAGMAILTSDKGDDLKAAGELFDSILSKDPSNRFALMGMVASYATIEPAKVAPYIDSLTSVDKLISGINIDQLEADGVLLPTKKRIMDEGKGTMLKKAKKKRVRRSRLPKDFDPNKKVDLERWLPMRDRSYYKPKGKKDKKKMAQATQGGKVDESLDNSTAPAVEKSTVISLGGVGKGGASKKKKKGARR